jgi:hypothetical protein
MPIPDDMTFQQEWRVATFDSHGNLKNVTQWYGNRDMVCDAFLNVEYPNPTEDGYYDVLQTRWSSETRTDAQ